MIAESNLVLLAPQPQILQCECCHEPYTPGSKLQKFCSVECRIKASRARAVARKKEQREHHCEKCNVELEPTSVQGKREFYARHCEACGKAVRLAQLRKWKKQNRVEKATAGICDRCSEPVVKGYTSCQKHLDRMTSWWREKNDWKELYDLTCEICEQPFQAKRRFTKFCEGCRAEAKKAREKRWREKNRKPASYTLYCKHCGRSYTGKRIDRMYCDDCKKKKPWLKKKRNELRRLERQRIAKIKRLAEDKRQLEERRLAAELRLAEEKRQAEAQGYHCYALGQFRFCVKECEPEFDWSEIDPTDANPGSEEKILILQDRIAKGLPLFHPEDRTHTMPLGPGFEQWLWNDHAEPTVNSHMNPKEHEYA